LSADHFPLRFPGETLLPDAGLRVVIRTASGILKPRPTFPGDLPADASISKSAVGRKRLYFRTWRTGDRFRPLGFRGTKKLQDVFTDAKIPADARYRVPLIECGGEIIWIPGYRVARGWDVRNDDVKHLRIRIERL
jgi:tRNA(Ile)-lysidine synthase